VVPPNTVFPPSPPGHISAQFATDSLACAQLLVTEKEPDTQPAVPPDPIVTVQASVEFMVNSSRANPPPAPGPDLIFMQQSALLHM
jgi:hypothetical protein